MVFSSSPISITASAAYRSVNEISEVATSPVPTVGETPFVVVIRPNTTQGWRPISVKIQPNEFAATGSSGSTIASRAHHRLVGARPRRVAYRIRIAAAALNRPRPIISLKDQYVTG